MFKLKVDTKKKKYYIYEDSNLIFEFNDLQSNMFRNYEAIEQDINNILEIYSSSRNDKIFYNLFYGLLNGDSLLIRDSFQKMWPLISEYVDNIEIKNLEREAKNDTLFIDEENVKKILKTSVFLKFYSLKYASKYPLPHEEHEEIVNLIVSFVGKDVFKRLLDLISASIKRRYVKPNHLLWTYLELRLAKVPDLYYVEVFDTILSNILFKCKTDENPITFLLSSSFNITEWMLKGAYNTGERTVNTSEVSEDMYNTELLFDVVNDIVKYSTQETILNEICYSADYYLSYHYDYAFYDKIQENMKNIYGPSDILFIIMNYIFGFDYNFFNRMNNKQKMLSAIYLRNIFFDLAKSEHYKSEVSGYELFFKFLCSYKLLEKSKDKKFKNITVKNYINDIYNELLASKFSIDRNLKSKTLTINFFYRIINNIKDDVFVYLFNKNERISSLSNVFSFFFKLLSNDIMMSDFKEHCINQLYIETTNKGNSK